MLREESTCTAEGTLVVPSALGDFAAGGATAAQEKSKRAAHLAVAATIASDPGAGRGCNGTCHVFAHNVWAGGWGVEAGPGPEHIA